ncbi:hypothetical protein J6590_023618 [Homalodisca vitripennis]|nr:hypothetical protein J6590_023618 [Homalodisca vitripennis]
MLKNIAHHPSDVSTTVNSNGPTSAPLMKNNSAARIVYKANTTLTRRLYLRSSVYKADVAREAEKKSTTAKAERSEAYRTRHSQVIIIPRVFKMFGSGSGKHLIPQSLHTVWVWSESSLCSDLVLVSTWSPRVFILFGSGSGNHLVLQSLHTVRIWFWANHLVPQSLHTDRIWFWANHLVNCPPEVFTTALFHIKSPKTILESLNELDQIYACDLIGPNRNRTQIKTRFVVAVEDCLMIADKDASGVLNCGSKRRQQRLDTCWP